MSLAIDVSKVKLHFRVNCGLHFGVQKHKQNRLATEGLPSSRTCVDMNVRRVWRTSSRRCKTMETQLYGKLLSRTRRNNRNFFFSLDDNNFADKTTPVLESKTDPKWSPFTQSQFDLLVSGRFGPRFGVRFPKTGVVLSANFCRRAKNSASFDCFRGYATEVLHTAGPLGFHGFTAPRALFATPCKICMFAHILELYAGGLQLSWNQRQWRKIQVV